MCEYFPNGEVDAHGMGWETKSSHSSDLNCQLTFWSSHFKVSKEDSNKSRINILLRSLKKSGFFFLTSAEAGLPWWRRRGAVIPQCCVSVDTPMVGHSVWLGRQLHQVPELGSQDRLAKQSCEVTLVPLVPPWHHDAPCLCQVLQCFCHVQGPSHAVLGQWQGQGWGGRPFLTSTDWDL